MSIFRRVNLENSDNAIINPSTKENQDTLNTKVGEVASTPTANTLLGRLKDIYDKLVSGISGTLKLLDGVGGVNLAKVDSQNRLYVYIPPSQGFTTIQLIYEKAEAPIKALQYQDTTNYTVPNGYDLNCITFQAMDNVNNGEARAINRITLGSFILSTGVFTDGSAHILPKFASKIYAYVTTQVGSTNDTITVTYTNQSGTIGRIASVILKSNVVGERVEIPLQVGDYGVIDITNITQSFVEAGAINIEGCLELFHEILTTNGTLYQTVAPLSSIVVLQGETIILQYLPSNASSVIRRISLVGSLVPR